MRPVRVQTRHRAVHRPVRICTTLPHQSISSIQTPQTGQPKLKTGIVYMLVWIRGMAKSTLATQGWLSHCIHIVCCFTDSPTLPSKAKYGKVHVGGAKLSFCSKSGNSIAAAVPTQTRRQGNCLQTQVSTERTPVSTEQQPYMLIVHWSTATSKSEHLCHKFDIFFHRKHVCQSLGNLGSLMLPIF